MNHLLDFDEVLGTCRCKACRKRSLTANIIARRDWEPPSIVRPAGDASAEDDGKEDEGEYGDKDDDEDMDKDEDEDEGNDEVDSDVSDQIDVDEEYGMLEVDEDASFEKIEKHEAEMTGWEEMSAWLTSERH